ncbi:LpxA family transferase [Methylobacterium sp. ID0610]|uniref:LpxA family transferase n=1 Tax=Methylobacterium carpenticola TaxID=3344827 RepID=UPI00367EBC08
MIDPAAYIRAFPAFPHPIDDAAPWAITGRAETLIASLLPRLDAAYRRVGPCAIHASATVEHGALLKGPVVVGPGCFVAAGSLLRGGCWLEAGCVVGPGVELKSSLVFSGAKLAHFNFVGDSLIGRDVNIEAGAIIASHRNEADDKRIRIRVAEGVIETGVTKFGALVGDGVRVGANAVVAPGALLAPGSVVPRLGLVDQSPG